jgi:hypothetical protein
MVPHTIKLPSGILATKLCLCAHDLRHDFASRSERIKAALGADTEGIRESMAQGVVSSGGGEETDVRVDGGGLWEWELYSVDECNYIPTLTLQHFYKETLHEYVNRGVEINDKELMNNVITKMREFKGILESTDSRQVDYNTREIKRIKEEARIKEAEEARIKEAEEARIKEAEEARIMPAALPIVIKRQYSDIDEDNPENPTKEEAGEAEEARIMPAALPIVIKRQYSDIDEDNPDNPDKNPTKKTRGDHLGGAGQVGDGSPVVSESLYPFDTIQQLPGEMSDFESLDSTIWDEFNLLWDDETNREAQGDLIRLLPQDDANSITLTAKIKEAFDAPIRREEPRRGTRHRQQAVHAGMISSDADFNAIDNWNNAKETYVLLLENKQKDNLILILDAIILKMDDTVLQTHKQKSFNKFVGFLNDTVPIGSDAELVWPKHGVVAIPIDILKYYDTICTQLTDEWHEFIFKKAGTSPTPRSVSPVFSPPDSDGSLINVFKISAMTKVLDKARTKTGVRGDTLLWDAYKQLFKTNVKDNVHIEGERPIGRSLAGSTTEEYFGICSSDRLDGYKGRLVNNMAPIDGNHPFFEKPILTSFKGTQNLFSLIDPMPILNKKIEEDQQNTIIVEDDYGNKITITLTYVYISTEFKVQLNYAFEWSGGKMEHNEKLDFLGKDPLSVASCIKRWIEWEKVVSSGAGASHRNIKKERLQLFVMKLIGDLGQEIYAACTDSIFFANDRPSSIRYMLLKLFGEINEGTAIQPNWKPCLERAGGGGYLTHNYYNLILMKSQLNGGGRHTRTFKDRRFSVNKRTITDKKYKKYKKYRRSLRILRSNRRSESSRRSRKSKRRSRKSKRRSRRR